MGSKWFRLLHVRVADIYAPIRLFLLLSCLLPATVLAEAGSDLQFGDLRSTYQAKKLEIDVAAKERQDDLLRKYAAAILQQKSEFQKRGNLDSVVWATSEIEAANSGNLAPIKELGDLPPQLQRHRLVAEEELEKIRKNRDQQIASVTGRYVDALKQLKISLTKSGKVERAIAVNQEIKNVSPDPEPESGTAVRTLSELPGELQTGLVAWFSLDEEEGAEVADLSRSGMRGVLSGTQFVKEGKIGGARRFSGVGDRIALQDQIPDSRKLTVSTWLQAAEPVGLGGIFCDFTGKGGNDLFLSLAGPNLAYVRADKEGKSLKSEIPLAEPLSKEWHHLTWVMGSRESIIYVDGEEAGRARGDGSNEGSHGAFIGFAHDGTTWTYFSGVLDEFMIWDRALDETEVVSVWRLAGGN